MRHAEEFDAFYAACYQRLVGQLAAITGDLGDAEDAVQEAFVRASRHWSRIRKYDGAQPELLRFDRHSGRLLGRVELDSGRGSRLESVSAASGHLLLAVTYQGRRPTPGELRVLRGERTVMVARGVGLADW